VSYFEHRALMWERQAWVRARPVAGDLVLGERLLTTLDPIVWRRLEEEDRRDVRRMKARIEAERIPAGEDPAFHLKLGPGALADVEFCAQLLQLDAGVRAQGTLDAVTKLAAGGHLDDEEAVILSEAYRFCERTRDRWFLVRGARADALPQGDDLARLARSLQTSPQELRDDYRRVTRRARRVVNRRFYGVD
jgi:glutamate-ammonia-ligase adenylyltransferase